VAGVGKVGRGCLAGPVFAAAVILDPDRYIPRVCDSKQVQASERERLYQQITRRALAWAVAEASPTEIDTINIHQASLQAMRRAVMSLAPLPDLVLVDAFRIPDLMMAQRGVVHGDQRCSASRRRPSSQGHARSPDAAVTRDPRYGLIARVMPRRIISLQCASSATRLCTAIVQPTDAAAG
jgi:ribonuclease HII